MSEKTQVFIPTFNRCAKLILAIDSVLNQKHKDVEIVVLDNGSTDGTQEKMLEISEANSKIKYKRWEKNQGMVPNFNRIQEYITGDFFSVLTDDDTYLPNFITNNLEIFKNNPEVGLVISNAPTRRNGSVLKSQLDPWRGGFYRAGSAVNYALKRQHPIITNCLFRGKLAKQFKFDQNLGGANDIFLLIKLLNEENVFVSKVITGYYDLHGENDTLTTSAFTRIDQRFCLQKKLNEYNNLSGSKLKLKHPPTPLFSGIYIMYLTAWENWDVNKIHDSKNVNFCKWPLVVKWVLSNKIPYTLARDKIILVAKIVKTIWRKH